MNIYTQGQSSGGPVRRYQNSSQVQNPVYMRKPLNYIDQYTNDRIPLNYNQYVQRSKIERLHEESNPTQFFNNPEYSTQDLFLTNQIPNQEEAIVKQKIDNEWNIRTQTETINIDSRARNFKIEDYEHFLKDKRNDVSVQGSYLSSYLFPNNFNISFNKQYANIKTVKLTSALFPNTRSRTVMYIDDTNNYFFVRALMKAPWLPFNFHIDQTTNLFDFQNFSFSVSDTYIKLYKFFQEIEQPYGIPRNINDSTINNYQASHADIFALMYTFQDFVNTNEWMWLGDHTFNNTINHLVNMEYFATTQAPIIFDTGKNYSCEFYVNTAITNFSDTNTEPYDKYMLEHFCTHSYTDLSLTRLSLYTSYTVRITHNFPEFITVSLVTEFPEVLEDNVVYILGEYSNTDIIPVANVVQNGIGLSFNRATFMYLRGYEYIVHYTFVVHDDVEYTTSLDVAYNISYIDLLPSLITGTVTNITSADSSNVFLMNGLFNGELYFNTDTLSQMLCCIANVEWQSANKSHIDSLSGYSTGVIIRSTEIGWNNYIPVGGDINYITMSAGVLNNINIYTQFESEGAKYYGTYVQGVPSITGNSLTNITSYVTRAIKDYFVKNGLDYSTFEWSYTNDLFICNASDSKIEIPYGEYTLDEFISEVSKQPIKVKSVNNIITSNEGIDYVENVKDNSRYYFFVVVQFQCRLKVSTEYYNNSYLLKFEIDNDSIQPLKEPISITAYGYTYTFTPDTVIYDIVCMNVYKYNVTGEIIFSSFFVLEPFFFHQEGNPEISFVQTLENPAYTKYNYAYNVKQTIQDENLDTITFFPAPLNMYNDTFVFPVNCTVTIMPDSSDRFTFFKILPDLPEGFSISGTTITGSSPVPFESIHYVYFYYYSGEQFRYYQQIKLINVAFTYNYSTVKLLNGYRFQGIKQIAIDSDIIATPYTHLSVELGKNWVDLSNSTDENVQNVIAVGAGINVGYLTGDIYGTPTSEFQMILTLTGEYNYDYYGRVDTGSMIIRDSDGNELTSSTQYIQSTSVELVSVNADLFYGDNSFLIYAYNYINDANDGVPQFACWAKPVKNEINNFISFHIYSDDVVSKKLLKELHFSYTESQNIVQTRYLIDYYQPTQVFTIEQTQLPNIRAWTTSAYTDSIIDKQYANTLLLDYYSIAENAVIYPLRHTTFGYASSNTRNIDVYQFSNKGDIFNPESSNLDSRLWFAIPAYVKNELNGYIFSQYYVEDWITSAVINSKDYYLYYPAGSFTINPITDIVDRIDPTITQYANILDMSTALSEDISSSGVYLYKYCLYNRCKLEQQIIYNPVNLDQALYANITVPDIYSNNNLLAVQVASKMNRIEPIVDEILSEYDYYNFEDFLWIQLYTDNYGEFENIFDPLTNRWYFAKIFFKHCEKRNDVSFNYFECPLYLCKNLNYIQEFNNLQVRIFDKFGNLYSDYNSTHYDFSFTLDIEYFIDDIRANGFSSRRPTQDNVIYNEELMTLQRSLGRK